jgi:hypothetical protein
MRIQDYLDLSKDIDPGTHRYTAILTCTHLFYRLYKFDTRMYINIHLCTPLYCWYLS